MPESDEAKPQQETCVYCKRSIYFSIVIKNEWSHGSGSTYCQTWNGFTATPLRTATPTYHGTEDTL